MQRKTGTAAILVKVEDVEDQPPEFVVVTPVTRVSEDAPVGSSVLQVRAVDGDRGINNNIIYSLSGGQDVFGIDPSTGVVSTRKTLDRESSATNNGAYIVKIAVSARICPPSTRFAETVYWPKKDSLYAYL